MKHLGLILFVIPLNLWAQTIEHGFKIGGNWTNAVVSNAFVYPNHRSIDAPPPAMLGAYVGYEAQIILTQSSRISVGMENSVSRITLVHLGSHFDPIGDLSSQMINRINMFGLELPIQYMIRTKKENFNYFKAGAGVGYLYRSTRLVERIISSVNSNYKDRQTVENNAFDMQLGNGARFNTFWEITFGRSFLRNKSRLGIELYYRTEFREWIYISIDMPRDVAYFSFARQRLGFGLTWMFSKQVQSN